MDRPLPVTAQQQDGGAPTPPSLSAPDHEKQPEPVLAQVVLLSIVPVCYLFWLLTIGIPMQRCFLGPLAATSFETTGVSGGVLRSTS